MRRSQLAVLAAVTAVIALLGVAVVVLADDGDDDPTDVATGSSDETSTTTTPDAASTSSTSTTTSTTSPTTSTSAPAVTVTTGAATPSEPPAPTSTSTTTTTAASPAADLDVQSTGTVVSGEASGGDRRVTASVLSTDEPGLLLLDVDVAGDLDEALTLVVDGGDVPLTATIVPDCADRPDQDEVVQRFPITSAAPRAMTLTVTVQAAACGPEPSSGLRLDVLLAFDHPGGSLGDNGPNAPGASLERFDQPRPTGPVTVARSVDFGDADGLTRVLVYDFGDGSSPERIEIPSGSEHGLTLPGRQVVHEYAPGTYGVRATAISTGSDGSGVQVGAVEHVLVVTATG